MSGTGLNKKGLKDPQVLAYLRMLDAATAALPAARSRELREQIEAHLEEVLAPDASEAEVDAELRKLGHPLVLAAEAGPVPVSAVIRLRNRLSRVRWWAWTSIGAVIAAAATVLTYVLVVQNVQPLDQDGLSTWYFPQDVAHSVTTSGGTVTQFTVPERFGQQQGFVVTIANNSDWTQTVIGAAGRAPLSLSPAEVTVGSNAAADLGGWMDSHVRWDLPGTIPPHSVRVLRVLWTPDMCMTPGGAAGTSKLLLRVRVGLITRTEDIPLEVVWTLSGIKAAACS